MENNATETKFSKLSKAFQSLLKKVFEKPFDPTKADQENKNDLLQRVLGNAEEILQAEIELCMDPTPDDILMLSMIVKVGMSGFRVGIGCDDHWDERKKMLNELLEMETTLQSYLLIKAGDDKKVKDFVEANMPKK